MMSDPKKSRAIGYARPICLNDNGIAYRALWQVVTDRSDSVSSGNDQWIAPSRSVKLVALWVQAQSYKGFANGEEIQVVWDDAMEMPPDFYADAAKVKGTGSTDASTAPPPGPEQKKAKPSQAPSSELAASSAGAGVSPAPDSEADEVSSLADEDRRTAAAQKDAKEEVMQGVFSEDF